MNTPNDSELGRFRLRNGKDECIITNMQVLWLHSDSSFYQTFIRDITSVKLKTEGFLKISYLVEIYKAGVSNPERTFFATQTDQEAMARTLQSAMRSYGR